MKSINYLFVLCFSISLNAQELEIYVSDAGNFSNPPWQILKFDGDGQNPETFISTNLNWPQDILFLEEENEVLISNLGSGCINKHNADTGEFISSFACSINGPTRIKIGPNNLLYVLQWSGNGKVLRYTLGGNFLGEFTSVGVPQSIGLDWDDSGNLYVSSYTQDYVRKFDTSGNDLGLFVNTNLAGPTNIWFDENEELLVSDYDGTAIKRFDANGLYLGDFITGLRNSEGVDYLPNGNILIGNGNTRSVKMYDSGGNYIEDLIPSRSGNLLTPNAVRVRALNTTGVDDQGLVKTNLIKPNFGTEFRIDGLILKDMEYCFIQNFAGQFIKTIEPSQDGLFALNDVPSGMYLACMKLRNDQFALAKIVVNK